MKDEVRNVLIFVSDSLRWDYLPEAIESRGVCFKTVAQSTYSPPSFATLSTGLYPPQHGVNGFGKRLVEGVRTTYDLPGVDGSYFNEGRLTTDTLYRTFGIHEQNSIADLTSPFWYLERDTTTHAPYLFNALFQGINVDSYFEDRAPNWNRIQNEYQGTIDESIRLLDKRLEVLDRLGELDDTLVVFTADHGELFGEYGDILHVSPTCPELVYVPTVFIHPSLSANSFHADPESDIIEHVDVIETCLNAIGKNGEIPTEGVDLFSEPRQQEFGYSHTTSGFRGRTLYQTDSLWWYDSGYVRVNSRRLTLLPRFIPIPRTP